MTSAPPLPPVPPTYAPEEEEPEFRPRPRRRAHPLTFVLAGLVIAAVGFVVGVAVQKHEDNNSTAAATTTGARANRFAGAAATGGSTPAGAESGGAGQGRGAAGGGAVIGQVKLVDGKNIYVTDTQGNVVKVTTTPSSTLTKTADAKVTDVAPGDTVVVRGTASADGSVVTATSVTDAGAGGAGGGFGFGGGFGGGGGAGG